MRFETLPSTLASSSTDAASSIGHRSPQGSAVRQADAADLRTINDVVSQAVQSWRLPARVLRLARPCLLYSAHDLVHMSVMLSSQSDGDGMPAAVALWEPADPHETPSGSHAVSLHGLYVLPPWQHRGVGRNLLGSVASWAAVRDYDAIVLRAWRQSETFFLAQGFRELVCDEASQLPPRRLWKALR
ncbi:MAG: GNAT superfamily N-acetyltransferase [Gammaproteobacteria bacterium]|jgi:GNAT superfamily N-acetyltransferase